MRAYDPLEQLVQAYLPPGAQIAAIDRSATPAICAADLDGDFVEEIAAVYRYDGSLYLIVLKHVGHVWEVASISKEPGERVSLLGATPVVRKDRNNLIVGWQRDGVTEHFSIYEWTLGGLRKTFGHVELPGSDAFRVVDLFPASIKTSAGVKWGYIDGKGNWRIQPQYEYASDFQNNGLARVQEFGHSGVINTAGQYVVRPIYDSIGEFSEGRSAVIDKQGFKLMDERGRIVTRKAYSYISSMKHGRALFSEPTSGKYGYLDANGNEAIPARYEEAGDFGSGGKAVVKVKEGEYALIGPDGERLATYPYAYVGARGDGLLPFRKEANGHYGYINEKGDVVIPPAYTGAFAFQEGRAVVNTAEDYKNSYGLIDKKGQYVIKPGYNDIRQLGEQRVALGKAIHPEQPYIGSVYAIATDGAEMLTDFRYNDVGDFHKGLASANDRRQTFFIDRSGNAAPGYPKINGSGTLSMLDSVIQANADQRMSYWTRAGQPIWQQNTIIPLHPPVRIKEEKYKPNQDYLVYYPQVEGMSDRNAQQRVNVKLKELSQVKPIPADTQLDYSYTGDFNVVFYKKLLLVLELSGYKYPFGAAHGMPSRAYPHINLQDGTMYELKDLFKPGSNYVAALSEIVGRQIKEDPRYSYVFPGAYKGIRADQPFYATEHALHLYFEPYEIAPYAAGFPTFTIPFAQIMNLIAVNGSFWRSFH